MKLSYTGIQNPAPWQAAGIALPAFDWKQMADTTEHSPEIGRAHV